MQKNDGGQGFGREAAFWIGQSAPDALQRAAIQLRVYLLVGMVITVPEEVGVRGEHAFRHVIEGVALPEVAGHLPHEFADDAKTQTKVVRLQGRDQFKSELLRGRQRYGTADPRFALLARGGLAR